MGTAHGASLPVAWRVVTDPGGADVQQRCLLAATGREGALVEPAAAPSVARLAATERSTLQLLRSLPCSGAVSSQVEITKQDCACCSDRLLFRPSAVVARQ